MPAVATRNQGKRQFIREVLHADPLANARAVNEAWRAAGMPGSISSGLVNHLRFRLGFSGNLRARRDHRANRGRPAVRVRDMAHRSTPAAARFRSDELLGLEMAIDRLLMRVAGIGQLPEVEAELRKARHQLYAGMVAGA